MGRGVHDRRQAVAALAQRFDHFADRDAGAPVLVEGLRGDQKNATRLLGSGWGARGLRALDRTPGAGSDSVSHGDCNMIFPDALAQGASSDSVDQDLLFCLGNRRREHWEAQIACPSTVSEAFQVTAPI